MKGRNVPAVGYVRPLHRIIPAVLALSLCWFSITGSKAQAAAPGWSVTGSMTTARDSYTATLLPNGKVLIAGGADSGIALSSAELYDPSTGTFSAAASVASAERYVSATDNPPVWSAPTVAGTNHSGQEGAPLNFTIEATDADGDTVTYSHTGLPAFCTLDSATGAVACAPGPGDAGSYPVAFHAAAAGAFAAPDPLSLTISIGAAPAPPQTSSGEGAGGGGCAIAGRVARANDISGVANLLVLLIPAIVPRIRRKR